MITETQLTQKEKTMLDGEVSSGEWIEFVSRPFSLFVVSIWHYCYRIYVPEITGGQLRISDGIFTQQQNGVVENLRNKDEMSAVKDHLLRNVKSNRSEIIELLNRATVLNDDAAALLVSSESQGPSYEVILRLGCQVAVFGALLPRLLLEVFQEGGIDDLEILERCQSLRSQTFYPQLILKLLQPKVSRMIQGSGIVDSDKVSNFLLVEELFALDFSLAEVRYEKAQAGQTFVYFTKRGETSIFWMVESQTADTVYKIPEKGEIILIGNTGYEGMVKGAVRVCVSLDGNDVSDFKPGDILVTINCTPAIDHLVRKCSAILSDEGGEACHAAIISKQLRIPCIFDLKNATKILKDGDIVEVDAGKGQVKFLERP